MLTPYRTRTRSPSGVVETLRPEPDQAQTIIKVIFKFLTGLMPIVTSNTHVIATLYIEGKLEEVR